jgi:hypothetical protein
MQPLDSPIWEDETDGMDSKLRPAKDHLSLWIFQIISWGYCHRCCFSLEIVILKPCNYLTTNSNSIEAPKVPN